LIPYYDANNDKHDENNAANEKPGTTRIKSFEMRSFNTRSNQETPACFGIPRLIIMLQRYGHLFLRDVWKNSVYTLIRHSFNNIFNFFPINDTQVFKSFYLFLRTFFNWHPSHPNWCGYSKIINWNVKVLKIILIRFFDSFP
jgi:hypothetical protein